MELARETQCPLLGGDTTRTASVGDVRAPATFSITAMGDLPPQMGLTRAGAHPGTTFGFLAVWAGPTPH